MTNDRPLARRLAFLPAPLAAVAVAAGALSSSCLFERTWAVVATDDGVTDGVTDEEPSPGAPGLGDEYYPLLGNGGYDVEHYDVALEVDMESRDVVASVRIEAVATQALSRFHLDLHGLVVDDLRVDGRAAFFFRDGDELVVTPVEPLANGSSFVVEVDYHGVPEPVADPGLFGSDVGWMHTDSGVYVVSQVAGTPSWLPCNDHPLDKARFSIAVTVEEPYVVAANGTPAGVEEEGTRRTFRFRSRDPMATYLATVNIAEFDVFEEEGPEGLPITTYAPTDATERELAQFARTAEMIEFFSSIFGPYPWESYGAVISYESLGGALETQTIPVYSRGSDEATVAHELAHQWYGDCVSTVQWRDLWLNEGFASYAEFLWFEYTQGPEAAAARRARTYRMLRASEVAPPAEPGLRSLFGMSVYVRGSLVLHALREDVGDEAFFEILATWVEAHHGGNATTEEFVEHCEDAVDRALATYVMDTLFAPDVPVIAAFEDAG